MVPVGSIVGTVGEIVSNIGDLLHPDRPAYKPVDLTSAATGVQNTNAALLAGNETLAKQVDVFSQDQVMKALKTAIPDYEKLMGEQKGVFEAQLKGDFAPGEREALQNMGAALGITSGTAGSDFSKFTTLGLGFHALEQRYNQGVSSAMNWLKTAYHMTKAPLMDVTAAFVPMTFGMNFEAEQAKLDYESQLGIWAQPNAWQMTGQHISNAGADWGGGAGTGNVWDNTTKSTGSPVGRTPEGGTGYGTDSQLSMMGGY